MDQKEYDERVQLGRKFMHHDWIEDAFESDQDLKKPQPPLCKAKSSEEIINLPIDFDKLDIADLTTVIKSRRSNRVYTKGNISLLSLSYLLWATQGVKSIRGKNYATLRTVPSGGARHAFETYMIIQYCDELKSGLYHYLPMSHQLEFIKPVEEIDKTIGHCVCEQIWANKCSILFLYTCVPYRCEWRYGYEAHRVALIDLGHVGENLYLACSALGLGTCGIAAFNDSYCDKLLGLDTNEEYIVYTQPVGTINIKDTKGEDAFYAFLKEE